MLPRLAPFSSHRPGIIFALTNIYIYIYSHREFATSKGDQSNRGEEQRGTDNKKWWQSKIWQIGGLIISGTALGSGAWGIKHYISDPKFPSHPAPSTLPSNEKPIASIYEEPYLPLITNF